MSRRPKFLWVVIIGLILGGCTTQSELMDDFSALKGWTVFEDQAGSVGYSYEYFRIAVDQSDTFLWTQAGAFFRNVYLEVEAAQIGGTEDNYFGLLCRIQDNGSFYAGLISSDGFYSIQRRNENGDMVLLNGTHWGISEPLNDGTPLKRIRFECDRDLLRLFVNSEELSVVRDTSLTGGDVGMIAGTFEGPSVEILFDSFQATELAP